MNVNRQEILVRFCAARDVAPKDEALVRRLQAQVISANAGLVHGSARALSRRYRLETDDCVQVGFIGLLRALADYRIETGFTLATYARAWIWAQIIDLADHGTSVIRVPLAMTRRHKRIERMRETLLQRLGRAPSDDELATATKLSVKQVRADALFGWTIPTSLSTPARDASEHGDGDGAELIEIFANDASSVETVLAIQQRDEKLWSRMEGLKPRLRHILLQRFVHERTLEQIGQEHGLSRARVGQLLTMAFDELRGSTKRGHLWLR